jgi:hypothetical protein
MQVRKYARMQVCEYASMQECKYASMQVCRYASMHGGRVSDLPESPMEGSNRSVSMQFTAVQVCKYANMQVCEYAWRVESLICLNPRWRAATGLATFHHRQEAETHRNISYFFKPKVNLKKSGKCKKLQPKLFNSKNYSFLSVHLINLRHN